MNDRDHRKWLKKRLDRTRSLIEQIEDAVEQLTAGVIESYTLDTGQGRQTVTKANMAQYNEQLPGLYNRLETLRARLYGSGVTNYGAAW